jgi:hypothetical protein
MPCYRDTSSEQGALILHRLQQALENRRTAKVYTHTHSLTTYTHTVLLTARI